MTPIQTPITGKEQQESLSAPYHALVQFYCAFNTGDLEMMSQNWWQSDEIAMDNPLGGIKRGWTEIRPYVLAPVPVDWYPSADPRSEARQIVSSLRTRSC